MLPISTRSLVSELTLACATRLGLQIYVLSHEGVGAQTYEMGVFCCIWLMVRITCLPN